MSSQTIVTNTGVQATINTDLSRIFLWENRYASADFNNELYDPLVMKAGKLLGRVAATQTLALCDTDSTDGSQYPIGILAEDVTIADGETKSVAYCIYGDVAEDKIILNGNDTLGSVVDGQSLRDRIAMMGVRIIPSTEMTAHDNS